jgi:dTDP-4-dehydrorhamnose 3,5-epimerase
LKFTPGRVHGAFVIDLDRRSDERGFFARLWCGEELAAQGLSAHVAQINTAVSPQRGTLRGMHYQVAPHEEVKIVRCARGAIFDVALDLRASSPTYRQWMGAELTAENARMLYVPQGCAHGYLTLADDTEVIYLASQPYEAAAARGVRYDDPSFGISWPVAVMVISGADRGWPLVS